MLEAAFASGITHFDTSPYYGYGLAESDLGAFASGRRDALTIATKVGFYPKGWSAHGTLDVWARKAAGKLWETISGHRADWRVERAEASLNASLKRLKCDYVDVLFLHEPLPDLVQADDFVLWLERQRSLGKIRYWGLAGPPHLFEAWLATNHPLAGIVQAKDSVERREGDVVLKYGRPLQFTFGYLRSALRPDQRNSAAVEVCHALDRNATGSVLFSTRRAERIASVTQALDRP